MRHGAGRHGRRGDQGRAPGPRRRHARLGPARGQDRDRLLQQREPQQALRHARPADARRPADRARPRQAVRRGDPELQVRRHRQAGPGLRTAAQGEPGPHLLLDLGLRPHRPRGRTPRLRPRGAGRGRPDGAERRSQPAAAEVRRGRRRPVHRHVLGAGRAGRALPAREDRHGPPHRDGAVRLRPDDHRLLRPRSAADGRRPAALRQLAPVDRALRRVRRGRRPAGDHRGQQRAVHALLHRGDRAPRPRGRRALQDQHPALGQPRGAAARADRRTREAPARRAARETQRLGHSLRRSAGPAGGAELPARDRRRPGDQAAAPGGRRGQCAGAALPFRWRAPARAQRAAHFGRRHARRAEVPARPVG
ncbi:hypothetical protein D3C87_1342430 [compost metagenome]